MLILNLISVNVISLKNLFFSLIDLYYKIFALSYIYMFNFINKTCQKLVLLLNIYGPAKLQIFTIYPFTGLSITGLDLSRLISCHTTPHTQNICHT